MILKAFVLTCAVAAVYAGGLLPPVGVYGGHYGGLAAWNPYSSYPVQPAISSQHSNILRSPFNLGQISTFSKAVDTPFSSVRKSDVRVSNPGVALTPGYQGIVSPVVSQYSVAAPLATPIAKVRGLLGVAYSAAPAVSHMTYTDGVGLAYAW
ncbi:cuticle protein 76-like [Battus philenor]|uniref:cuticle protein 76-like n=1 Tax=Battus philenor TaxID=42288 RepID=UPI0035D0EF64